MRFFFFAVFAFGVARTIVSALSIALPTSSLTLERRGNLEISGIAARDFDELDTPIYLRNENEQYHVGLFRSKVNTEQEHWSLRFHPAKAGGDWHIVDAASDGSGTLSTDKRQGEGGYKLESETKKETSEYHRIGTFENKAKAGEAMHAAQRVKLTKKFPEQNCVDWTHCAVNMLTKDGHIDKDKHKQGIANFQQVYATNKEAVRKTTNTRATRDSAGRVSEPKKRVQKHIPKPAAGPSRRKNPDRRARAIHKVETAQKRDSKKRSIGKSPSPRAGTPTNASAGSSKGATSKSKAGRK